MKMYGVMDTSIRLEYVQVKLCMLNKNVQTNVNTKYIMYMAS